jgi:hypothetical protein
LLSYACCFVLSWLVSLQDSFFIGSGLDLKVFHICFLMLSFASSSFMALMRASFKITVPSSKALKKALLGDNPCFLSVIFFFYWVLEVVTTVMTSPYPFYFVFVPRIASNRKKVRFGKVAVPKQIYAPRCKNSWKIPARRIDLRVFVHMPQVII